MLLAFNGIFRRRLQVKFKQTLKAALAHPTISDQVLIHLPFHHPFIKPYKLVSLFYTVVCKNKIVVTISAAIALFTLAQTFFMDLFLTANRTGNSVLFIFTS